MKLTDFTINDAESEETFRQRIWTQRAPEWSFQEIKVYATKQYLLRELEVAKSIPDLRALLRRIILNIDI